MLWLRLPAGRRKIATHMPQSFFALPETCREQVASRLAMALHSHGGRAGIQTARLGIQLSRNDEEAMPGKPSQQANRARWSGRTA